MDHENKTRRKAIKKIGIAAADIRLGIRGDKRIRCCGKRL